MLYRNLIQFKIEGKQQQHQNSGWCVVFIRWWK